MNNYIFTDHEKNHYKRIDKRQARRAYNDGKTVILCPCNLKPSGFWRPEIIIKKDGAPTLYKDFNKRVNYFEFYNCINAETGKYSAFYIQI